MRAIPNSEIIGQRFGRLIALAEMPRAEKERRKFLFLCECGTETIVLLSAVRCGTIASCGCLRRETAAAQAQSKSTHGECHKTPEHRSWQAMLARCNNPEHHAHRNYGGRGIRVCDRWSGDEGYTAFLSDMGRRPKGTTLDRYPNKDGNYEPGNCRWATPRQQLRNTRVNRLIEFRGETFTIAEASERFNKSSALIRWRLGTGMSVEDALLRPVRA